MEADLTWRWCGRAAASCLRLQVVRLAAQHNYEDFYKDFPVSATEALVPMEERTASL